MMFDPSDYEGSAAACMRAVVDDRPHELASHLDDMAADDLHSLMLHAQVLAVAARKTWTQRVARPANG